MSLVTCLPPLDIRRWRQSVQQYELIIVMTFLRHCVWLRSKPAVPSRSRYAYVADVRCACISCAARTGRETILSPPYVRAVQHTADPTWCTLTCKSAARMCRSFLTECWPRPLRALRILLCIQPKCTIASGGRLCCTGPDAGLTYNFNIFVVMHTTNL